MFASMEEKVHHGLFLGGVEQTPFTGVFAHCCDCSVVHRVLELVDGLADGITRRPAFPASWIASWSMTVEEEGPGCAVDPFMWPLPDTEPRSPSPVDGAILLLPRGRPHTWGARCEFHPPDGWNAVLTGDQGIPNRYPHRKAGSQCPFLGPRREAPGWDREGTQGHGSFR